MKIRPRKRIHSLPTVGHPRKETLGEYLKKRIESGEEVNTTFHLIKVPTADELDFYIQQYKIREGHSEWSERFNCNIWIKNDK